MVNGIEYEIRTDYRDCLRIFQAMNDPDLSHIEKLEIIYRILYVDPDSIPIDDIEEAYVIQPLIKLDENFFSKFEIIQNGDIQQYIRFGMVFLIVALIIAVILG